MWKVRMKNSSHRMSRKFITYIVPKETGQNGRAFMDFPRCHCHPHGGFATTRSDGRALLQHPRAGPSTFAKTKVLPPSLKEPKVNQYRSQ